MRRDSAREFAKQGFVVIRVESCHWRDLKMANPKGLRNPYEADQTEQQTIRSIVMRDITCPLNMNVVQNMRSGALPPSLTLSYLTLPYLTLPERNT